MLGFIKRQTQHFQTMSSVKLLYCSLVRPHVEYCSSVWSPHYATHVRQIERIQHKFLKYISFKFHLDRLAYDELESRLNIGTLELRRDHKDLKVLFNILNGHLNCPEILHKISLYARPRLTRNPLLFNIPFHRTNYGQFSPINRILRLANRHSYTVDFFGVSFRQFLSQIGRSVV